MAQSSAPPHRAIQRPMPSRRPAGLRKRASILCNYKEWAGHQRASSGSSLDQQAPRLSLAHTSHDGFSRSRGMAGETRKVPTAGDEQTASSPRSVRRFIVPSEVTGLLYIVSFSLASFKFPALGNGSSRIRSSLALH